jgi:hypothetical protein
MGAAFSLHFKLVSFQLHKHILTNVLLTEAKCHGVVVKMLGKYLV